MDDESLVSSATGSGDEAEKVAGQSEADTGSHVAAMSKRELAQERRSLLMKLFADTGTAKIPAVIRLVLDERLSFS